MFRSVAGFTGNTGEIGSINITIAELQTAIDNSSLVPGSYYSITNYTRGTIYLLATSTNSVDPNGVWIRDTNLVSFGWVRLTGSAGSVDSITVGGVNVMSAPVAYTTSLTNTASLVAANIAANSANTGWTAIAVYTSVVVYATSPGTATNGLTVSGTSTTLVLTNTQNTVKGEEPRQMTLSVMYDPESGKIMSCIDTERNISISTPVIHSNAARRINDFRWGDLAYFNLIVDNGDVYDNFYITDGAVQTNKVERLGKVVRNIGRANNYFYGNEVSGEFAAFQDNFQYGVFAVGTPQVSQNIIRCFMSGNIFTGNGASMYGNRIFTPITGGIFENTLSGTSVPQISYNLITGQGADINQNTLAAPRAYINNNIIAGREAAIYNNSLNVGAGGTEKGIRNNYLNGFQSAISSNVINAPREDCGVQDCFLDGRGSTISSNTFTDVTSGLRGGIFGCRLTGDGSGFTSNTFVQDVRNVILEATNGVITGIDFTTYAIPFSNFKLTNDFRLEYFLTKSGLSLTSGVAQTLGIIPFSNVYVIRSIWEASGLVSAGSAEIQVGIQTDDPDGIMQSTVITGLNQILNPAPGMTATKTAAAGRLILIQANVANVTAGNINMTVEMKISPL